MRSHRFHVREAQRLVDDLRFGREFHSKISKMAIVGEHHWEKWIAKIAAPLYARDVRYFPKAEQAWAGTP